MKQIVTKRSFTDASLWGGPYQKEYKNQKFPRVWKMWYNTDRYLAPVFFIKRVLKFSLVNGAVGKEM